MVRPGFVHTRKDDRIEEAPFATTAEAVAEDTVKFGSFPWSTPGILRAVMGNDEGSAASGLPKGRRGSLPSLTEPTQTRRNTSSFQLPADVTNPGSIFHRRGPRMDRHTGSRRRGT